MSVNSMTWLSFNYFVIFLIFSSYLLVDSNRYDRDVASHEGHHAHYHVHNRAIKIPKIKIKPKAHGRKPSSGTNSNSKRHTHGKHTNDILGPGLAPPIDHGFPHHGREHPGGFPNSDYRYPYMGQNDGIDAQRLDLKGRKREQYMDMGRVVLESEQRMREEEMRMKHEQQMQEANAKQELLMEQMRSKLNDPGYGGNGRINSNLPNDYEYPMAAFGKDHRVGASIENGNGNGNGNGQKKNTESKQKNKGLDYLDFD